jgi:uncharacterized phage protein (TIGR01671 family)
MREIKFRAWTGAKMLEFDFNSMVGGHGGEVLIGDYVNEHDITNKKLIFMQYTGLKDKNGVEIFEGDVVTILDSKYYDRGVIDWYENAYELRVLYSGNWDFDCQFLQESEKREVLGNIYENSDLLRVKEWTD